MRKLKKDSVKKMDSRHATKRPHSTTRLGFFRANDEIRSKTADMIDENRRLPVTTGRNRRAAVTINPDQCRSTLMHGIQILQSKSGAARQIPVEIVHVLSPSLTNFVPRISEKALSSFFPAPS
jgi:hypothetical protein